MPEILFIADDKCVLALIDHLQPLVRNRIHLENDYSNGVKRIFDCFPAAVFLQRRIGELSCDKMVNQVKLLLDGKAVPLILLSDAATAGPDLGAQYEACFDLALPSEELGRQIQNLLQTLPAVAWTAGCAEPQPAQAEAGQPDLPVDDGCPAAAPLLSEDQDVIDTTIFEVLPYDFLADFREAEAAQAEESPSAPSDPPAGFARPGSFEAAVRQEPGSPPAPPAEPAPVSQHRPQADLRRIERSNPNQLFGSMSDSAPPEPYRSAAGPHRHRPPGKVPPRAGSAQKSAPGSAAPGSSRPAPEGPTQTGQSGAVRAGAPGDHDLPDSVALALGIKSRKNRPYRRVLAATMLGLAALACIASLDLFFTRNPEDRGSSRGGAVAATGPNLPAALPPAAQPLPSFVPRVPPDPRYAASHPGWERYQADELEYLVCRENGRVRAVQVLGQGRGAITLPFFKTCVRTSTGQEQCVVSRKEVRDGLQIESGLLPNGTEFQLYREVAGGGILGFVLSFPGGAQSPA